MVAQKWRTSFSNVVVFVVSTCLMLVVSELVLRLFYPQQLGVWHQTRDGLAIHRPNSRIKYLGHEVLINSLGMRDREHSIKKKDGTFRILLLGDSFMEALQVPFDESFPKLLEDRLRESGSQNVEVINVAVSGWGTEDELAYLVRYGKRLEPDLVLVAMTLHNDVSDNLREQFYTLNDSRLLPKPIQQTPTVEYWSIRLKGFVASHFHIFQLWRKYWYRAAIQTTGLQLNNHVKNLLFGGDASGMARGWQLTFQEMAAIQGEGKAIGAKTAVMLIPLALQLSSEQFVSEATNRAGSRQEVIGRGWEPQTRMIKFGKTQGIEIVDLLPAFAEWKTKHNASLYLEQDGHWNAAGHKLAASHVASELLRMGLLQTSHDHNQ